MQQCCKVHTTAQPLAELPIPKDWTFLFMERQNAYNVNQGTYTGSQGRGIEITFAVFRLSTSLTKYCRHARITPVLCISTGASGAAPVWLRAILDSHTGNLRRIKDQIEIVVMHCRDCRNCKMDWRSGFSHGLQIEIVQIVVCLRTGCLTHQLPHALCKVPIGGTSRQLF